MKKLFSTWRGVLALVLAGLIAVSADAATRKTPTTSNYGATIFDSAYADRVDTEVEALWSLAPETVGTVAGTNTITAACTPACTAYSTKVYWLTPANSNTGPATLNLDSLGAKNVKTYSGSALSGGELAAGVPTPLYYTGVEFRIGYPQPATVANALPLNYLSGFTLTNDAGDTNNYIGVAAGVARDSTNAVNLVGSALVKKLNFAWAAGTSAGGVLQSANLTGTITITTSTAVTGSGTTFSTDFQVGDAIASAGGQCRRITVIGSNTSMTVESAWGSGESGVTYKRGCKPKNSTLRFFAIYKDADASVDYASSLRDTPVDLPAGYSKYRRIGYVLTDASANNRQFIQTGRRFLLVTKLQDFNSSIGSTGTTANGSTTLTSSAPPSTTALYEWLYSSSTLNNASSSTYILVRETSLAANQGRRVVGVVGVTDSGATNYTAVPEPYRSVDPVILNSSGQFIYEYSITTAGLTFVGNLFGWDDPAGRD